MMQSILKRRTYSQLSEPSTLTDTTLQGINAGKIIQTSMVNLLKRFYTYILWILGILHYINVFYWLYRGVRSLWKPKPYRLRHYKYGATMVYKAPLFERCRLYFIGESGKRKRLLKWITGIIPKFSVDNFTLCWSDGVAICALIDAVAPETCPRYDLLNPENAANNCRIGMRLVAKTLGIVEPMTPEEMSNPKKIKEEVMIRYLEMIKYASLIPVREPEIVLLKLEGTIEVNDKECTATGSGLVVAVEGKRAKFNIHADAFIWKNIYVEITGRNGEYCKRKIDHAKVDRNQKSSRKISGEKDEPDKDNKLIYFNYDEIKEGEYQVIYIPCNVGKYTINITWGGEHIKNSPFTVQVKEPRMNSASKGETATKRVSFKTDNPPLKSSQSTPAGNKGRRQSLFRQSNLESDSSVHPAVIQSEPRKSQDSISRSGSIFGSSVKKQSGRRGKIIKKIIRCPSGDKEIRYASKSLPTQKSIVSQKDSGSISSVLVSRSHSEKTAANVDMKYAKFADRLSKQLIGRVYYEITKEIIQIKSKNQHNITGNEMHSNVVTVNLQQCKLGVKKSKESSPNSNKDNHNAKNHEDVQQNVYSKNSLQVPNLRRSKLGVEKNKSNVTDVTEEKPSEGIIHEDFNRNVHSNNNLQVFSLRQSKSEGLNKNESSLTDVTTEGKQDDAVCQEEFKPKPYTSLKKSKSEGVVKNEEEIPTNDKNNDAVNQQKLYITNDDLQMSSLKQSKLEGIDKNEVSLKEVTTEYKHDDALFQEDFKRRVYSNNDLHVPSLQQSKSEEGEKNERSLTDVEAVIIHDAIGLSHNNHKQNVNLVMDSHVSSKNTVPVSSVNEVLGDPVSKPKEQPEDMAITNDESNYENTINTTFEDTILIKNERNDSMDANKISDDTSRNNSYDTSLESSISIDDIYIRPDYRQILKPYRPTWQLSTTEISEASKTVENVKAEINKPTTNKVNNEQSLSTNFSHKTAMHDSKTLVSSGTASVAVKADNATSTTMVKKQMRNDNRFDKTSPVVDVSEIFMEQTLDLNEIPCRFRFPLEADKPKAKVSNSISMNNITHESKDIKNDELAEKLSKQDKHVKSDIKAQSQSKVDSSHIVLKNTQATQGNTRIIRRGSRNKPRHDKTTQCTADSIRIATGWVNLIRNRQSIESDTESSIETSSKNNIAQNLGISLTEDKSTDVPATKHKHSEMVRLKQPQRQRIGFKQATFDSGFSDEHALSGTSRSSESILLEQKDKPARSSPNNIKQMEKDNMQKKENSERDYKCCKASEPERSEDKETSEISSPLNHSSAINETIDICDSIDGACFSYMTANALPVSSQSVVQNNEAVAKFESIEIETYLSDCLSPNSACSPIAGSSHDADISNIDADESALDTDASILDMSSPEAPSKDNVSDSFFLPAYPFEQWIRNIHYNIDSLDDVTNNLYNMQQDFQRFYNQRPPYSLPRSGANSPHDRYRAVYGSDTSCRSPNVFGNNYWDSGCHQCHRYICDESSSFTSSDFSYSGKQYPGCKVFGVGLQDGYVNMKNNFQVETSNASRGGHLSVNIRGPHPHSVTETSVVFTGDDLYEVIYEVNMPGFYVISVKWSEHHVLSSPYIVAVKP